jgi:hypothetical protein
MPRPTGGCGEAVARSRGERGVRREPELGAVAPRLLEVIPDDLVQFYERGAVLLQPAREPLVQLCARRLRQRVVGGVADQ